MEFELDPTIMLITSGIGVLVNIMYVLLNLPFALKKLASEQRQLLYHAKPVAHLMNHFTVCCR